MKIRITCLMILGLIALTVAGCCTTEERVANFTESVHNIALDGDGVN